MPAAQGTNNVASKLDKLGVSKSLAAHRDDEVNYGSGGDMPAGVIGVARLSAAKIDSYKTGDNAGELYLYLAGVCEQANKGMEMCVGSRTSLTVALCKTGGQKPKSFDDNFAKALNEIKKLGLDISNVQRGQDVVDCCSVLVEAAPRFKFNTWASAPSAQYPDPRVNHNWNGLFTGAVVQQGGAAGVADNTVSDDTGSTEALPTSWEELGAIANDDSAEGCQEARTKITEAGNQHNIDTENAATWSEAAALVAEAENAGGGDGSGDSSVDAPTPWMPEKGQKYSVKLPNARNPEQCEVTAVYSETVNLKRSRDNQGFKAIPFTSDPPTINKTPIKV